MAYGDVLESAADYEVHYQRLKDHLAHCNKSDIKRRALGRPNERTLEEDLERNQSRWFKEAFDHHATKLGAFLERQRSGNLKRRAEVPHIQWDAHKETMRLLRNDPARALSADDVSVIDTAAVDVSAVTNKSNIFTRIFVLT